MTVSFYPGDFYKELEQELKCGPIGSKRLNLESYIPIFIVQKLKAKLSVHELRIQVQGKDSKDGNNFFMLQDQSRSTGPDSDSGSWTYIKNLLKFVLVIKKTPGISLDIRELRKLFIKEIEKPSLDLIWLISGTSSKCKIFTLSSHLLTLASRSSTNCLQSFMQQFTQLTQFPIESQPKIQKRFKQILQDFIYEFISLGFMELELDSRNLETIPKVHEICRQTMFQLVEQLMKPSPNSASTNRVFLSTILQSVPVTKTVKKRFYRSNLMRFLLHESDPPKGPEEILKYQEKYAAPIVGERFTEIAGQIELISILISDPFSQSEILEILKESIESKSPNWSNILLTIQIWERNEGFRDNTRQMFLLLKEYIRQLLCEGLENRSSGSIAAAFILARHSSLISPTNFARYEKWWTGILESETASVAKTSETFTFLCEVLKSWVTTEPVCFLQVHATYWPFVPSGVAGLGSQTNLRALWAQYVQMSKERISEYRELEEIMMDYEPNPNNPVQYDVEQAIKAFDNSKKIPNMIGQMLMFKRKYFNEHFLPALLKKPAGIPQSDGRLCLIEALNADGKIPLEMYINYKKNQ